MAGERIDLDVDRLSGPDVGELRLLVVGDDVGGGDRHHRHQLRSGLDVLANAQRAGADDAVDRRDDRRIGEVQLGLMLQRLVACARRLRLSELGLQDIDLPDGGLERGRIAGDGGAGRADARGRLLGVLHAAIAGGGKRGVALVVLVGESEVRLLDADRGAGGVDHRLLRVERSLFGGDRRLGSRDVGLGLLEGDPEISIINPGQRLARLDGLIVADEHGADVARDFGRNRRVVRLDIGVVRRDLESANRPIFPAEIAHAGESEHARAYEKRFPKDALRRSGSFLGGRRLRHLQPGRRHFRRNRAFDGEFAGVPSHRTAPVPGAFRSLA